MYNRLPQVCEENIADFSEACNIPTTGNKQDYKLSVKPAKLPARSGLAYMDSLANAKTLRCIGINTPDILLEDMMQDRYLPKRFVTIY